MTQFFSSFRLTIFAISIFAILFYPRILANDSTATVAAGGIEFKKSDVISMDKEVLRISKDLIEIEYIFTNHSDKDVTEQIAFPLPPWELRWNNWDEYYIASQVLNNNPDNTEDNNSNLYWRIKDAPFINFTRWVDGHEAGYDRRFIAKSADGKDITKFLKDHGIPLSIPLLIGNMEAGLLHKDAKLVKKLKRLKLLDASGVPNWKNQTIYFWNQHFPAKQSIHVKHTYRPATGYHWASKGKKDPVKSINEIALSHGYKKWQDYCPTQSFADDVVDMFNTNTTEERTYRRVYEVAYILTTGANWKGPIKDFTLEITPPEGTVVSLCWPGTFENQNGKLVSHITNFTPKQDLKVIFLQKKVEE